MRTDGSKQRIALLFGIPVTQEELHQRADDRGWDYGRQLLAGRSVARAFAEIYAPVCLAAADLMHRAAAANASIYRAARLSDLAEASATHDVLVLVAHWRGSQVREQDFGDKFSRCLAEPAPGSPLALLADELVRSGLLPRHTRPQDARRGAVVHVINELIGSGRLVQFFPEATGGGGSLQLPPLLLETLSRDLLDACFGEHLQAGNQLELTDGPHCVAAVNEAVAADFDGVIDLSCCTSSVLGSYLELERGDAFDVIMGDHCVVPAPQLRLIDSTLELMSVQPQLDYAVARRTLSRGLDDWYRRRQNSQPAGTKA